ncbi:cat eye syndrome chromosome region, candidate 1 [Aspergillus hancockii]|nr:cat eye syndrome chromosome region, candidate 1 [Aspergillus hancockii]
MAESEIEQHLSERSALLEREKTNRHDYAFEQNMSPVAKTAATILANIRKTELNSFWTASTTTDPSRDLKEVMFPGMSFALSRNRMEGTSLWKIIAAMPKGCLLHAHMEAMIDIDWLIDQALELPGFFIASPQYLWPGESKWLQPFEFHYRPGAQGQGSVNIWQSDYPPNQLVPVNDAAWAYPGGVAAFKAWAISRMTIKEEEALEHHHGIADIWRKFASCFRSIAGLFYTEPIFRRCVPRLLQQLHDDGIKYVELRLALGHPFYREGFDVGDPNFSYFFQCFQEEIQSYMSSPQGAGFWGARMIWTAIRGLPEELIKESMVQCLAYKEAYPSVIAGFDFVGQEDLGHPLVDLLPLCKWFQRQCKEKNLQIPFFLHAGECLGDGDSTDGNIVDAILLNSRRIGHGFSLYKHPLLIDLVKEKKILIEMCPISHEVLRLTSNIMMHPMPALLSRGVAVSLNNDDPAVLGHGQNGLSHDFYQVMAAFENTGLSGLATMAEDSIRWAAFEDETDAHWLQGIDGSGDGLKASRIAEWRSAFEEWCEWIVKNFAAEHLK